MSIQVNEIEWEKTIKQAKKGDKEAFATMYKTVYQDLYKFALYTLGNQQDAEDVVSEATMNAYSSIKKLKEAKAFRSWIFKITANLCKRKMREYYKKTEQLNEYIEAPSYHIEEKEDLRRAMKTLDKEERLLIYLSVFGGYKSKEIAEILNMNVNTVRSKKSRAYEKLEKLLLS